MIPVGYLAKRVAKKPDWLNVDPVADIFAVSNCVSPAFADYIQYWKHNGYWLFNSPADIRQLAADENLDLAGTTLFYYEAFELEFAEFAQEWSGFRPEPTLVTAVQAPLHKQLAGFDVVAFSCHSSPECSPLSCNALATSLAVNLHCLFNTFAEAKAALENGLFRDAEPGPYRIFAVYTISPCCCPWFSIPTT